MWVKRGLLIGTILVLSIIVISCASNQNPSIEEVKEEVVEEEALQFVELEGLSYLGEIGEIEHRNNGYYSFWLFERNGDRCYIITDNHVRSTSSVSNSASEMECKFAE